MVMTLDLTSAFGALDEFIRISSLSYCSSER